MLTREQAMQILEPVHDMTRDVDVLIYNWPLKPENVFKDLETLQIRNRLVYDLFRRVQASEPAEWNGTLAGDVKRFLVEEFVGEKSLERKFACLNVGDKRLPLATWTRAYSRSLNMLMSNVRLVSFLLSDLFAFDALPDGADAVYLTMIAPVISSYHNEVMTYGGHITIKTIDNTDSLRAYADGTDAIKVILCFAKALRERVYAFRQQMGLLEAVNIGIGVSYERCKFHLLTGEPHPDTSTSGAPVWYEAAKLMGNAEKLCKYSRYQGGVILVSEAVSGAVSGNGVCKTNMRTVDSLLPDVDVNIYEA